MDLLDHSNDDNTIITFENCEKIVVEINELGKKNDFLAIDVGDLLHLGNTIRSKINKSFVELIIKHETIETLIAGLDYLLQYLKPDINISSYVVTYNNFHAAICTMINSSKQLRRQFHVKGGTMVMVKYLSDDELVRVCFKHFIQEQFFFSFLTEIPLRTLMTLHNVTKLVDEFRYDFEEMNLIDVILKLIKLVKAENPQNIQIHIMFCYLVLANIMNEKQIETLPDSKRIIESLVQLFRIASSSILNENQVNRQYVDVEETCESQSKIVCIDYENILFNMNELVEGLYRLAVKDSIKYEIYENYKVKNDIKKFLSHGNEKEQEIALMLLWQLCFDKNVAEKVRSKQTLVDYINELATSSDTENKNLKRACQGLMWLLKSSKKEHQRKAKEIYPTSQVQPAHIMISYNKESRDLCIKIKQELEKNGFKIWIDFENIHGSSLDSMARAIENSKCVLICATEKYKNSNNCRLEAEYVFNRNVPFIPLIMQKNYKPDGWLGILFGTKIYIDFTRREFAECIERLKNELKNVFDGSEVQKMSEDPDVHTKNTVTQQNEPSKPSDHQNHVSASNVENWKQSDIQDWLKDKSIDKNIRRFLKNYDGEMLKEIYILKKEAIQYFYQTLTEKHGIDFESVIRFSSELNKLFNKI